MFTEAQNFAIVQTELDTVFFQNFEYDSSTPGIATAQSGELFKVVPTTHAAYIGEVNKGSGLWRLTAETQTVAQSTPAVRNKYTIYVGDYTDSIPLSKDLFDDNMHGVWSEDVKQFALMARVTQDNNAFALFRNAFTTTLTADGVAFISASHTLIGGGTVSNVITGALSDTTINTAIVALREQKNQAGVILGGVPSILLVPSKLFKYATQLTESALVADNANNAINVYRSAYGFKVMSSPYLGLAAGGSDTAWFMLTPQHSVSRLVRQGVETALTPWQYSTNRTYNYQGNFRESYFVPDYAGTVGSTGV
jgi:phage major head subunit gpT-like protein